MSTEASWMVVSVPKRRKEVQLKLVQTTVKVKGSSSSSDESLQENIENETKALEDLVKPVLADMGISTVFQQPSKDGDNVRFIFCVQSDQVEEILLELDETGLTQCSLSSVTILPAPIHCAPIFKNGPLGVGKGVCDATKDDADKTFCESIKSRLLVAEIISRIDTGSDFTFDFLMLLFVSGMIAGMGLLEDSAVVIVASLLISPLLGPILAGVFGVVVHDYQLMWKGIYHELVSLIICITQGFLHGLIFCYWYSQQKEVTQWPTELMMKTTNARALWLGALVSLPSGAGVALSILSGNGVLLSGVAISGSLLPSAINAGLLWAESIYLLAGVSGAPLNLAEHHNVSASYQPDYHNNVSLECFVFGVFSLLVTLLNIMWIIVSGVLILLLKEVTSEKMPSTFMIVWK